MLLYLLMAVLVLWCGLGAFSFWSLRGATVLRASPPDFPLRPLPTVSIIVAARNEEDALPRALQSMLALDYPDYEIILVDDDSRDRTGAMADEWASRPSARGRLKVIHNKTLPSGWSGKVHALHLAAAAATGEWVLATDADMVFQPLTLRVAMCFALSRGLQLLSIAPEFDFGSFWEKVVLPSFTFLISLLFPLRLVNDPSSSHAMAAGAFMLMKREDLEALGGYARLKKVVIEDLRMAQLFKRHGRLTYLAASRGLFHTRMYTGGREMFEGLSRSAFEGTGFSVPKVLGGLCLGNLAAVFPWVALIARLLRDACLATPGWHDPSLLVALLACAAASLVYLPFILHSRLSLLYVFALPLATLFYSCVSINSALASMVGRGVSWKGRNFQAPGG
jgi:hopene-associated glycosyltransferase HpnB